MSWWVFFQIFFYHDNDIKPRQPLIELLKRTEKVPGSLKCQDPQRNAHVHKENTGHLLLGGESAVLSFSGDFRRHLIFFSGVRD